MCTFFSLSLSGFEGLLRLIRIRKKTIILLRKSTSTSTKLIRVKYVLMATADQKNNENSKFVMMVRTTLGLGHDKG